MKKTIIGIVVVVLVLSIASAELSYFAKYKDSFSPMALEAADKAKLPEDFQNTLTQFERELYELGYAAGYDAMRELASAPQVMTYVLNTSSHKFHDPSCSGAKSISEKNRMEITCTRDELIEKGYEPCGSCKP